jgi:chromatin remodeling complex protein RSC6
MGQEEMARHEVVKKVWAIIKEKNLYDPKNKQFAICDEQLHKVKWHFLYQLLILPNLTEKKP